MSELSEEEIINGIKNIIECEKAALNGITKTDNYIELLQGLLDLYQKEKMNSSNLSEQLNKEKEKNKELEDKIKRKIKIRKEEKAECKDSIEANLILREIYVLEELLEERN